MNILSRDLEVVVDVAEALKCLRENKETHKTIVREAREGYVEKAKKALLAKLDRLKSGEIVGLAFSLTVPQDYTHVYDTAIKMLELHMEETVTLNGSQVRCLMMDEWDWTDHFIATNAGYSGTAREVGIKKGLSI